MAERTLEDELYEAERRLQAAMLAGDVEELDQLLDERLVFTGPPDGQCHTDAKELDLRNHRSRTQVMTEVTQEDLTVLVAGSTGVTCFLGTLKGTFAGEPFALRMRYTRTWRRVRLAHPGRPRQPGDHADRRAARRASRGRGSRSALTREIHCGNLRSVVRSGLR
ncbi:nuclear transport factor 2 family protein [Planobispora longispora]|uniref:DUF4440 domain-containing protein n=1 Tax=Planobispora longispora TaxID=28887 RepID=A0A8J3W718_9ACTN|nr:nuclear transport factor 2 family protein [Planobispora longispora]BFE83831.1 hypothetical protein GCM10020093_064320 [Planobispora longispora]GIH78362.1 hypothetical protein Plo01_47910 [Planobispora longispora]